MQRLLTIFLIISLFTVSQAGAAEQKATPKEVKSQPRVSEQKTLGKPAEVKPQGKASDVVEVEADKLVVNKAKGEAVYTGNVKATQGNIIINSQKLTLYLDSTTQKIKRLVAEKKVYIKMEDRESTSDRAEYTIATKYMVLTGNVVMTRGPENKVTGQMVTMDMVNDHTEVVGGTTGRVKMKFENTGNDAGVMEWKK